MSSSMGRMTSHIWNGKKTCLKPPTSTIFHHDIPLHQGSWGWSSRTIHVGPWCGSNPTPWGDVANFLLGIILQTPGSVDGKSPFLALKPIFSVCLGEIPLVIIAWNVSPMFVVQARSTTHCQEFQSSYSGWLWNPAHQPALRDGMGWFFNPTIWLWLTLRHGKTSCYFHR